MPSTVRPFVVGASVLALCASSLGIAQGPAQQTLVCARDGSATLVLPAGTQGAPDDDALRLFETDHGGGALECADGRNGAGESNAITCHFEHSGFFALQTYEGPLRMHALGTRKTSEQDGAHALREDVVLVDEHGRPVHTLVQWSQEVKAHDTTLLRRRFKVANLDHEGGDELCIESLAEVGPGSVEMQRSSRFRPTRRSAGYDAFAWDGQRLVHVESLDRLCPRSGYRLFVDMPSADDPIAARRDQR